MKLYLYDFDGTIYDGDSSVDFFKFCLKKNKKMLKMLFPVLNKYLSYKTKSISDTELKEYIFSFLKYFDNIDDLVNEFWISHKSKIKDFCNKLKVKDLIASDVDKKTGHFNKPNNRGEEKVKVFRKKYADAIIEEMYSDSEHDKPLFLLAKKAILVKGNRLYDYNSFKPNIFIRFWRWGWSIYHKNEEVWNYLIMGGLTTLVSLGSYALFAKGFHINYIISNVLSWILAVLFAYFTNRTFVFHSKNVNKMKEFISFTGSRLLTLLLDTGLMMLFVEIIKMDDLIAKIIVQVVIVIANYAISKLFVFKNK